MTWRVAGINFDHSHMGDLLRMTHEHPDAEIVGICHTDRERMATAIENFAIPAARIYCRLPRVPRENTAGHS